MKGNRSPSRASGVLAGGDRQWSVRGVWLVCLVVVSLAGIVFYASEAAGVVLFLVLSEGVAAVLLVVAGGLGGWFVLDRLGLGRRDLETRGEDDGAEAGQVAVARLAGGARLEYTGIEAERRREIPGALWVSICAGMGLGLFGMAVLVLGLAGLLNGLTGVVLVVGAGGAGLWGLRGVLAACRERPIDLRRWSGERVGAEWLWLLPAGLLGVSLVAASVAPGWLWRPADPHPYDILSYHLQVPREWFELGRIVPLDHNVFSFFPFHMEMHYLLAMHLRGGPWAGMYLAQFISLCHGVLAVLGVYGLCRMLRPAAGKAAAVVSAAAMAVLPWVVMLSTVTFVESGLLLYTVLGAGMLLVGWDRLRLGGGGAVGGSSALRWFLGAGVMVGFAGGVKYTAIPMLLLGLPVAVMGTWLLSRRAERPGFAGLVKGLVVFGVAGVMVVSPWLVRNTVWSGNPVFPLALRALGPGHLTDDQVERWERAHRPAADRAGLAGRASAGWSEFAGNAQYGYLLLPLAAVGAVAGRRDPRAVLLLLLFGIMLLIWLFFTHLIGRFLVMSIPVMAVLTCYVPRQLLVLAAAGVLGMGLMGMRYMHPHLAVFRGEEREVLIGLEDLSLILPAELIEMDDPGVNVALIGDAGAFNYQTPMSRLVYRTVFDVEAEGVEDFVEAWLGDEAARRGGRWLLVIHPLEVERLSRTYYGIPGLPGDFAGPRDRVSVVRR